MRKSFVVNCTLLLLLIVAFLSVVYFINAYPVKYKEFVQKYSKEFNLSESLVYSIIKVESGFNKNAISSSNAMGLMQLKFDTANEIAGKISLTEFTASDLFDAELNIRMGCFYLRYLLNYYNENLNYAIYAYNAGMGNVNKWLGNENIVPKFKETRDYLTKIESAQKIYKNFYGII